MSDFPISNPNNNRTNSPTALNIVTCDRQHLASNELATSNRLLTIKHTKQTHAEQTTSINCYYHGNTGCRTNSLQIDNCG